MVTLIIFDFDGVLADSGPAHLQFLRDRKKIYAGAIEKLGLNVCIPTNQKEFRKMVNPPMLNLVRDVGFGDKLAEEIVKDYEENFFREYSVNMFKNVEKMLEKLKEAGFTMAIVSANVMRNIKWTLGPYCQFFKHILTLDNYRGGKVEKIRKILFDCITPLEQAVFVGDMMVDYEAAKIVGIRFVGVNYGWGNFSRKEYFPIARSVRKLTKILFSL